MGADNYAAMTVPELQEAEGKILRNMAAIERDMADLRKRLEGVRDVISRRTKPAPAPKVSDHALLRFIERVHGVDIEAIRSSIMSSRIVEAIKLGATSVTVDGVKMIVRDGVIITVVRKGAQ